MYSKNIEHFKKNYNEKGTVLVSLNSKFHPLNMKDLIHLNNYCEKVDKEFIKIGDAGEPNHLLVGRFMTDIEKPLVIKNPYSKNLLKILNNEKMIIFLKKIVGLDEKVYLRRVQFNQIDRGCFVGHHLDVDSNPDYIAACVIQLGGNFKGGLYRVYQKNKTFIDYSPKFGSIIISDCTYPHEVTKVINGRRKSLVFFISKNFGLNRRKR